MAGLGLGLGGALGRHLQVGDGVHAHGDTGLLAEHLGLPAQLVVGGGHEVVRAEEGQLTLLGESRRAIERQNGPGGRRR